MSAIGLATGSAATCTAGSLLPGDAAEDGPDGQPEARQVPSAEDVAGHQFAGCGDVLCLASFFHFFSRPVVVGVSHVGKGDAGAERVAVERRLLDRDGPVGL